MLPEEHLKTARDFLKVSDREFEAGDVLQGSEKLWGAFSHALTAVCQRRGWKHGTHRQTLEAGRALIDELNDLSLAGAVAEARHFHNNFYNNYLEDYEIEAGRPTVHAFVERAIGLLEE